MKDEYARFARLYAALLDPILSRTRRSVRNMAGKVGASRILDICCGTGALCRELAEDGLAVTGADLSSAMLAEARRRTKDSPAVGYLPADARALPFESGAFDVCVLSLCLHENEPKDRPRILAEASRVGRRLVVVDYSGAPGAPGVAAHVPERIAGRRHYAAFRHFMGQGGLEGLLYAEGYAVMDRTRVLLGAGICVLAMPGRRHGESGAVEATRAA
ncbi:MAG: class I SAM-dependent methyltransferase, partial [Oceanidesulfovibrio sp.]